MESMPCCYKKVIDFIKLALCVSVLFPKLTKILHTAYICTHLVIK